MRFIIEDHKTIFQECLAVLNQTISVKKCRKDVFELLLDLNYLSDPEICDTQTRNRNRSALLALAARMNQIFELPLPHAPGATFVGGMVSAHANGTGNHENHDNRAIGVGGRGVDFQQAFQSCIGEAAEYLSFIQRDADPLALPKPDDHGLSSEDSSWALSGLGLANGIDCDQLDWIKAKSLVSQNPAWFPASLVLRQPQENTIARIQSAKIQSAKIQSESSGISAGVDLTTATASGLLEVIERDAIALWWYGGQPASKVDNVFLKKIGFLDFANDVRRGSTREFWLLDLSTEFEVPVFGAFSSKQGGEMVIAGFSGGYSVVDAMKGAFLEMCQMELAQEISLAKSHRIKPKHLTSQDKKWLEKYNELSVENYPRLLGDKCYPASTGAQKPIDFQAAIDLLQAQGFQSFVIDLTRPEIEIAVTKVLIPGLQSTNPKWLSSRLVSAAKQNTTDLETTLKFISPI